MFVIWQNNKSVFLKTSVFNYIDWVCDFQDWELEKPSYAQFACLHQFVRPSLKKKIRRQLYSNLNLNSSQ